MNENGGNESPPFSIRNRDIGSGKRLVESDSREKRNPCRQIK